MSSNEEKKKTIVLFDVDGTLTIPRKRADEKMLEFLQELRKSVTVGIVGGSDLVKICEQLNGDETNASYDYVFSENGLLAFKVRRDNYCSLYHSTYSFWI